MLFLISFPAEFLIAIVPHEPVLFYFAKYHSPLIVSLVAVSGTIVTEVMNYSFFKYISDLRILQRMMQSKLILKSVKLFNKSPLLTLWLAGFTPVPFYPFRFLVVLAHYPIYKYILAIILSRTPRFYLYSLLGQAIRLSNRSLIIVMVSLIIVANVPILKKVIKEKIQTKPENLS